MHTILVLTLHYDNIYKQYRVYFCQISKFNHKTNLHWQKVGKYWKEVALFLLFRAHELLILIPVRDLNTFKHLHTDSGWL